MKITNWKFFQLKLNKTIIKCKIQHNLIAIVCLHSINDFVLMIDKKIMLKIYKSLILC